jgi:predicted AAA+ superfamily ATPase
MDKKDIAGKLEINVQTLDEYLNILEKMYIIDKTYTWTKTDYQRIGKQSHIFLNDTGLMSSILNWNFENINLDADKTGKIIETYVYNQLVAQVDLDYYTSLYHYRDWEKHEVDFIIETENEVFGIDAKAGASTGRNDFKNLKWFSDKVPKDKKFTGVILYTGEQVLAFGDNMYLVPINNLWE